MTLTLNNKVSLDSMFKSLLPIINKYLKHQILPHSSDFLIFRPLYWIRHFEFRNFELGFVISDPKIPEYQKF